MKVKTRKQKRQANRIIIFDVKLARRSNYNIDLRELRINKITAETTEALTEKPTDSSQ